uniref:Centromere protein Cenp-F N-terminal domain-containing protein n=1 Tax=Oreochromis aureus TaxID=47969 RepID=A0AAZ1WW10_OREAU
MYVLVRLNHELGGGGVEGWTSGKALQKIQEMEVQLDKMKKEKTQKQFQLDSLEAAIQKQKQKVNIYHKSCWLFLTVIILL